MLLDYTTQILVSLGLIRLLAVGLEAIIFARWHLKESGKNLARYYWMAFHSLAAWLMVLTIFRFVPGQPFGTISSYITFAALIYMLMFFVPPYRSKIGLGFTMIQEIEAKKPQEATLRLIQLMNGRVVTALCGIVAFFLLLLFRYFIVINDYFFPVLTWLTTSVSWLYWTISGITAVLCCISTFFAVQLLFAGNRQKMSRKKMEEDLGRKLTQEDFLYRYVDEQNKKQHLS